jgi:hypothetical protein
MVRWRLFALGRSRPVRRGRAVLLKMVAHSLAFAALLGLLLFLPARNAGVAPGLGVYGPFM